MDEYEEGLRLLEEKFGGGKDNVISLATVAVERAGDGAPLPAVRGVDAYYEGGAFYVTTNARSNKMKEIAANRQVSIASCAEMFTASGVGESLGWVMEPRNAELRAKLRAAFAPWYDSANDEKDTDCCILAIRLSKGVLNVNHWEKLYRLDFESKACIIST
ncbi:MAG: pyridoxamine 5'-phosphate oxidase family protein [Spirochaetes bacterium]|nr:pyridoxamine 5'-phosphate oxidase family protein [Spirochaetota bacterium]MBU1079264.1 pyridoxamine 5'-phosphate oxidase family protein [Spirochaetota bacterium]